MPFCVLYKAVNLPVNNGPDADNVIRETTKQSLPICRPSQRNALGFARVFANINEVGFELIDNGLALKVKDLDAAGGGSAEPVAVRAEDQGVDDIAGLQRVQVLAIVEVPQHGNTILATRGSERTVRRDRDGVDVAGVAIVVGTKLALAELPNLDNFVPPTGDNHRVQSIGAEADARNPLGVAIILDIEFALAEGVPQLDGAVPATTDNLPVISTEADTKDIRGVADETTSSLASVQIPETEGMVPGGRKSELAIRGDDDVGHEVVVAVENALGVAILVLLTT